MSRFPLRFLQRHTVRRDRFHLWLSFLLLTVWSFPMSWDEAPLPVPQNKTPWWPVHAGLCEAHRRTGQAAPVSLHPRGSWSRSPECPTWLLSSHRWVCWNSLHAVSRQTPGSVLALWWLRWGGGEETRGALRRLVITSTLSHLAMPPRQLWPKFMLCALRQEALLGSRTAGPRLSDSEYSSCPGLPPIRSHPLSCSRRKWYTQVL